MFVPPGGAVSFGFNVRFNQPFQPSNFSLCTDTPGTINFFSSKKGDWLGSIPLNDNHVGYFRANISVPACVPPGNYFLSWNVINLATGRWRGRPSCSPSSSSVSEPRSVGTQQPEWS